MLDNNISSNNTTLDSVETSIKDKYPIQGSQPKKAIFNGADYLRAKDAGKIDLSPANIKQEEIYTPLSSGEMVSKYPTYIQGLDNEQRLAQQQSTAEKWGNGLLKLGGKTLTAVAGGTLGVVEGVINGVSEGSLEATYNSDFSKWLDDLNTKMDYNLPNYYTQQEKDAGFVESLGTANFWANDLTEGLSFTLGTIVSEGIWAYATGGSSLLAKGFLGNTARWGSKALSKGDSLKALSKYKDIVRPLIATGDKAAVANARQAYTRGLKLSQMADNARFLATSAGYEAGVESRHYIKSTTENWLNNYEDLNGKPPSQEEITRFQSELQDTANAIFGANLALVGSSNLAVFGNILKGTPINQTVKNSVFKNKILGVGYKTTEAGKKVALEATKAQKIARKAYVFGKYSLLEGVVEEGGQGVFTATGENYMLDTYKTENINDSISMIDSMIKGFEESYGTKEGRKGIGIGMIVGLFGAGISTRGRFDESSAEQKEIEQLVEYSNAVTNDLVLERIKANSRIKNANDKLTKAQRDGNVIEETLAQNEMLYAKAIRDIRLGGLEAGYADFEAYLNKTSDEEILNTTGETNADEYRAKALEEYKRVGNVAQQNLNFAENMLGTTPLAGDTSESNVKTIAEAVAYNMTMLDVSGNITSNIAQNLKELIAENLDVDLANTVSVEQALKNVGKERYNEYKTARKKVELSQQKIEKLNTQILDTQTAFESENAEGKAQKLNELNKELVAEQQRLEQLNQEKEVAFRLSNIPNLSNGEVTMDMLDNQQQNLQRLEKGLTVISPQNKELANNLFKRYEDAVKKEAAYGATVEVILDPKSRASHLNGWLSKLANKNKNLPDTIKRLIEDNTNSYEENQIRAVENTTNDQNEAVTEVVDDAENDVVNQKTSIENQEQLIDNFIKEQDYLTKYLGEDIKNNKSIDQKDVERYNELLGKASTDPQQIVREPFQEGRGLTEEETQELKDLNRKLNDWQTIKGSGIADELDLLEQLKKQVNAEQTSPKTTVQNIVKAGDGQNASGAGDYNSNVNTIQNPSEKGIKYNKTDNTWELVHTKPESLTEIIPDSTLEGDLSGVVGTEFTLTKGDNTVKFKVTEYNRLSANREAFDKVLEGSGTTILNFETSNYMPLYRDGVPLQGDFGFVIDGEAFVLDEGAAYDLKPEDTLIAELNLKDEFNKKLLEDYRAGKITKKELTNRLSIQVKPKNSPKTRLGVLRGLGEKNSNSPSVAAMVQLRDSLLEKIDKRDSDVIDLQINIPVNKILIGTPNVRLDQDGTPQTIAFNSDSIKQVVATGYTVAGNFDPEAAQGSTVRLNKTLKGVKDVYVRRVAEMPENQGKKIPTVVFKYRNTLIAFPVDLIEAETALAEQGNDILDLNISSSQKATKFVKLLQDNKLNPSDFNINFAQEGWENTSQTQNALDALGSVTSFADVESWRQKGFNPVNLIDQAEISVDLTNKPLLSGKVVIRLEDRTPYDDRVVRQKYKNRLEQERIDLTEELSQEAIDIDNQFQNTDELGLTVKEEDSEFLIAIQDEGTIKTPTTDVEKRSNVNKLRNALTKSIPRKIRNIIGSEKIKELRDKFRKLDKLQEQESEIPTEIFPLSDTQINQLTMALASTPFNTSEDLFFALRKAFITPTGFNPTVESMVESGLYSQVEAETLFTNTDKMEEIKTLIDQLEVTEEIIESNFTQDERFISNNGSLDIIGKLETSNSYVNKQEALDLLGGIKDRQIFEDELNKSDLDYLKDSYDRTKGTDEDIFIEFSMYDRVPVRSEATEAQQMLEETLTPDEAPQELLDVLDTIIGINTNTTTLSNSEIAVITNETLELAKTAGLDLLNLRGESLENLKPLFTSLADFLQFQDESSFNNLITEYNKINNLPQVETELVIVSEVNRNTTGMVYYETNETTYEVFENEGLIPLGDNVYKQVQDKTLDTLYTEVSQQTGQSIQELRNQVIEESKLIEKPEEYSSETLEIITLHRIQNQGVINNNTELPQISNEAVLYNKNLRGLTDLQTQFVADFNKEIVDNKQRNTTEYQEFYSKFKINSKGIVLKSIDPLTMAQIKPYLKGKINTYLQITNQIPVQGEVDFIDRNIKRSYYLDNPKSLPIFTENYERLNDVTLLSKASEDFIRVGTRLYENTETLGDYNFYSELPIRSGLKTYELETKTPKLDIDLNDYNHLVQPESNTKVSNKYSKDVEQEIDKDMECS